MPSKKQTLDEVLKDVSSKLKLSATRPNIYGYTPHEKQVKFHASAARGKLYIGGNRSGKTTGGVAEDLYWLSKSHPYRQLPEGPIRGRVIGVDFNNGIQKILLPEFARWCPPSWLINGSWTNSYSAGERKLTLANGSFVEFMSQDQDLDKFAGTSRHFVHYDEECPKEIFDENSARLIDTAGSWWMTMTPVNGMTWIYDDIFMPGKTDPLSNIDVIQISMEENPHLQKQEVEMYLNGLTADDREARGKGKFVQMGGLVFKHFDVNTHVIDAMVPPKTWEWYASVDHGFSNPTCWLWHAVSPSGQVITFGEHYENERTVDYHAKIVHMRNAGFGRIPDTYVGDPAMAQRQAVTGTSIQTEYVNAGIPLVFGNNDVAVGINRMSKYLEVNLATGQPNWLITRNCVNLIREMQRLRWKTFASKKTAHDQNRQEAIHKKNDHAPDSAKYFFSLRPELNPLEMANSTRAVGSFDAVTPSNIDKGAFDWSTQHKSKQTEWTTIDETLGGIW